MRDYIFRGKTKSGKWVYGSLIHVGDFCYILDPDNEGPDYPYLDAASDVIDVYATPVIPETVGQFTGLLDKNGNRIFEGDIVEHHWGDWDTKGRFYNVRWEDHSCGFEPFSDSEGNCGHCDGGRDPMKCQIIGNIWDNPELLKGE